MARQLIINFLNEDYQDWSMDECVTVFFDLCHIDADKPIVIRRENHLSHSDAITFELSEYIYEWVEQFVAEIGPKNGCQIYKGPDGYYLCLTDCNYYDAEDKYKGTDETHLYMRNFVW